MGVSKMANTILAVVKDGKIETVERVLFPEGTKLLVTMLSDDDTFWQEASQESLKKIWDNREDDVYAQLLNE
jgi:hypothetical protein